MARLVVRAFIKALKDEKWKQSTAHQLLQRNTVNESAINKQNVVNNNEETHRQKEIYFQHMLVQGTASALENNKQIGADTKYEEEVTLKEVTSEKQLLNSELRDHNLTNEHQETNTSMEDGTEKELFSYLQSSSDEDKIDKTLTLMEQCTEFDWKYLIYRIIANQGIVFGLLLMQSLVQKYPDFNVQSCLKYLSDAQNKQKISSNNLESISLIDQNKLLLEQYSVGASMPHSNQKHAVEEYFDEEHSSERKDPLTDHEREEHSIQKDTSAESCLLKRDFDKEIIHSSELKDQVTDHVYSAPIKIQNNENSRLEDKDFALKEVEGKSDEESISIIFNLMEKFSELRWEIIIFKIVLVKGLRFGLKLSMKFIKKIRVKIYLQKPEQTRKRYRKKRLN